MKQFKSKLLATAVAIATGFATIAALPQTVSTVDAAGTMTASEITTNMGIGWNLGNTLDSTGTSTYDIYTHETAWGNPQVTQALIDTVAAKGFTTVRIPTTWYTEVTETTDANGNKVYTIDEDWLARVKEVVDYCYNDGLYVILNLHHEQWINRSDFPTAYDDISEHLTQYWTQIATYFADYDQHLIFEGMNEPRQTGTTWEWQGTEECYEVINKLDADFVNTVRSVSSPYQNDRLLMVPCYCAGAYSSIYSYLEVPDDDYVAVSLHAYTPYAFAMGDGDHTTFSDSYKANLDSLFSDIRAYFTDKDIPVVLGEFSASNYNNTSARVDWATYYVSWMKKLGIPCVLWDNNCYSNSSDPSEAHGYLNRSSLTWYENSEPVVDAMMSVMSDSSIVWGSDSHLPNYVHSDISSGDIIYENQSGLQLQANVSGSNCTPGLNVTSSQLGSDREIAIKYSGNSAPILALCKSDWNGWTEISPYIIDSENGIAYYDYESISKAWGDLSTAAHLFARAGSDMTIYEIASIPAATISTVTTTTTTQATTTEETTTTTTITIPTVTTLGDVNEDGSKNIADAVMLQKYLIGNTTFTKTAFENADVIADGSVDGVDLMAYKSALLVKDAIASGTMQITDIPTNVATVLQQMGVLSSLVA